MGRQHNLAVIRHAYKTDAPLAIAQLTKSRAEGAFDTPIIESAPISGFTLFVDFCHKPPPGHSIILGHGAKLHPRWPQ